MSIQKPLNPDNNDQEQAMQTDVLLIYPYFYTHASFPDFCLDYIESNSTPLNLSGFVRNPKTYPGIYFNKPQNKTVSKSASRPSEKKTFDLLPIPDRGDYDHLKYQQFWSDRKDPSLASIMTSYGCPFDCDFCSKPVFGNRLRLRDMDKIFKEIRDIKNLGYDGLWIADDCFSLDQEHTRCFCHRLISEKLDMTWFCLSRVDRITQSDIPLWQDSGRSFSALNQAAMTS